MSNTKVNQYQKAILLAFNRLGMKVYEGTADPVEVQKRRNLRKGVKGRPADRKASREWNKFNVGAEHIVNRAKKNEAQQEALLSEAPTTWTSEWRIRNEARQAAAQSQGVTNG